MNDKVLTLIPKEFILRICDDEIYHIPFMDKDRVRNFIADIDECVSGIEVRKHKGDFLVELFNTNIEGKIVDVGWLLTKNLYRSELLDAYWSWYNSLLENNKFVIKE